MVKAVQVFSMSFLNLWYHLGPLRRYSRLLLVRCFHSLRRPDSTVLALKLLVAHEIYNKFITRVLGAEYQLDHIVNLDQKV